MEKIQILGLGPGAGDYILPITVKKIREASVIVAGKRNLSEVEALLGKKLKDKEKILVTAPLEKVLEKVKQAQINGAKIAMVVSGDPGFYSMLSFMRQHFTSAELEVIPGISSMQTFFARLNIPWQEAYIGSLHGKTGDLEGALYHHRYSFFLTDHKYTPYEIKKQLYEKAEKDPKKKAVLDNVTMYIGEHLTYPEEKITRCRLSRVREGNDNLCVVVLENENYEQ